MKNIERRRIITIGGITKSGKSKTVEELLKLFPDYTPLSAGAIARSIGREYGFDDINKPFNLFPEYARKHHIPYDQIIDQRLRERNQIGDCEIIDCRLGYFMVPTSYKVSLKLDLHIAADRVLNDLVAEGKMIYSEQSLQEVTEQLMNRRASDLAAYKKRYGTNYLFPSHYDLVIDTGLSKNSPKVVARQIHDGYNRWLQQALVA